MTLTSTPRCPTLARALDADYHVECESGNGLIMTGARATEHGTTTNASVNAQLSAQSCRAQSTNGV